MISRFFVPALAVCFCLSWYVVSIVILLVHRCISLFGGFKMIVNLNLRDFSSLLCNLDVADTVIMYRTLTDYVLLP